MEIVDFKTIYDFDRYLTNYVNSKGIKEIIRLCVSEHESEINELVTKKFINYQDVLFIIDFEKTSKLNNLITSLETTNYNIIAINITIKKNVYTIKETNYDDRQQIILKHVDDPNIVKELLGMNILDFHNEIKKIQILNENKDQYKIDYSDDLQQVINMREKYETIWFITKYPDLDDQEISDLAGVNAKRVYYFRKERKNTNLKLVESKLKQIYNLFQKIKKGQISPKILSILLEKAEKNA